MEVITTDLQIMNLETKTTDLTKSCQISDFDFRSKALKIYLSSFIGGESLKLSHEDNEFVSDREEVTFLDGEFVFVDKIQWWCRH